MARLASVDHSRRPDCRPMSFRVALVLSPPPSFSMVLHRRVGSNRHGLRNGVEDPFPAFSALAFPLRHLRVPHTLVRCLALPVPYSGSLHALSAPFPARSCIAAHPHTGVLCIRGTPRSSPLGPSRLRAAATGPESSACRRPLAPTSLSPRACRVSLRYFDGATEIYEASVEDPPPASLAIP